MERRQSPHQSAPYTVVEGAYRNVATVSGVPDGSVDGYLAAMSKIVAMADNDTRIIAGHGAPLASRADVQAAQNMIVDCRGLVKPLVDRGMSEDEVVAANPLAPYHDTWNWQFITTERMTRTLVRDLAAE